MEQITAYFLTALEVLEKEFKLLKQNAAKAYTGLCCIAVAIFLVGAAILILAWACYTAFSLLIGPVLAGLAAAGLLLTGGGVMLWIGNRSLR